jgi:TRAP-type uncharacterized transport system substrate-binding protein
VTPKVVGRRIGVHGALAILLVGAMAGCGSEGGGIAREFRSIGTAGTGGIYYPLGGALASRLALLGTLRQ